MGGFPSMLPDSLLDIETDLVTTPGMLAGRHRNTTSLGTMDPAGEYHRLSVLRYLFPLLLCSVFAFEMFHQQFSNVRWDIPVDWPQELESANFGQAVTGANVWIREYFLTAERGGLRMTLLTILVVGGGFRAYLGLQWTLWTGSWYGLLEHPKGHMEAFWPVLFNFVTLLTVELTYNVYYSYITTWFLIDWKTWMQARFRKLWFADRVYYLMELHAPGGSELDNPDQRISEDTRSFCDCTFGLGMGALSVILDLFIYVPMLWTLSPRSVFGLFECPGWLLYLTILWSGLGTLLIHHFGRVLIALNYVGQHYDADFRFNLVRVRSTCESIALLRGEAAETEGLTYQWDRIRRVTWETMNFNKRFSLVQGLYRYSEWTLSLAVLVPGFIRGEMTLPQMRICQSAIGSVKGDFDFIINSYGELASWRVAVARLQSFERQHLLVLGKAALFNVPVGPASSLTGSGKTKTRKSDVRTSMEFIPMIGPKPKIYERDHVSIKGLEVWLPNGTLLLSFAKPFEAVLGDRVLITGPAGSGKSTLVRALAGVWPHLRIAPGGACFMPPDSECLFVPRVPSLPPGSIRAVVSYPEKAGTYSDGEIDNALRLVNMSEKLLKSAPGSEPDPEVGTASSQSSEDDCAPDPYTREADWGKVLSGGEQQRLVIAHILLRRPKWVFLDEATSSMSRESAAELYSIMNEVLGKESVIFSITHDVHGLLPFHSKHLVADPDLKVLIEIGTGDSSEGRNLIPDGNVQANE